MCVQITLAQNFTTNHRKYWYYKSRLNNDFMKVGTNAGESLIFNERGIVSIGTGQTTTGMHLGDGTSTLGYYIAQLSLEYYLLRLNNQKTDSTLYELACALYAINRLDLKAETTLGTSNCSASLNVFFIRDDVSCDFIQNNYEHFNYFSAGYNNNSQSRGFASKFNFGMNILSSDWCDGYEKKGYQYPFSAPEKDQPLFYVSQDQVYALLYGLAFVRKFVPNGVFAKDRYGNTFWFQDGQMYISEEAKSIAKRIIDNIRNPKKCDGSGCPGDDWDIKYPHNCDNPKFKGFIKPYAFALAESECVIDHKNFGNSFGKNICTCSKCSNSFFTCSAQYHNTFSLSGGKELWDAMLSSGVITGIIGTGNVGNRVMMGNMLATCNCYYPMCLTNASSDISAMIADVGNYYWYMYHQPLARYLLHEGQLKIASSSTPVFLLNEMNACNHFNLGGNTNYSSLGWSTDTRLEHPERIGNNNDWRGEYPSIDYMLYFNLWTTKTVYDNPAGVYPQYINLSHYYINSSNNYLGGWGYYNPPSDWQVNAENHKIQIDAYETIYMEKTKMPFYTNKNYMRAGKEIIIKATSTPGDGSETHIKPGVIVFSVSDGTGSHLDDAGIRFYIKKYDCATDNGNFNPGLDASYPYRTFNSDSLFPRKTSNDIIQNEIKDTLINNPKPHYIEYSDNYQTLNTDNNISMNMDSLFSFNNQYIYFIPNPAVDKIKITLSGSIEYNQLEIVDAVGRRVVDRITIDSNIKEFEINISSLFPGFYIINLYYNDNFITSKKFIKK